LNKAYEYFYNSELLWMDFIIMLKPSAKMTALYHAGRIPGGDEGHGRLHERKAKSSRIGSGVNRAKKIKNEEGIIHEEEIDVSLSVSHGAHPDGCMQLKR
jgi:hypothetical protein